MYTCFISYSRNDLAEVKPIIERLEKMSFIAWFDQTNIIGGQAWSDSLKEGIAKSNIIIFFVSSNSKQSTWCLKERSWAEASAKPIIPVLLESVCLPDDIKHLQYVDFTKPDGPERLVEAILHNATGSDSSSKSQDASPQTQSFETNIDKVKTKKFHIGNVYENTEDGN